MSFPLQTIILLLIGVINLCFIVIISMRGKKSATTRLFVLAIVCNVMWTLGDAVFLSANKQNVAISALNLFFIAPMITAYLLLLFSWLFQGTRHLSKRVIFALLVPLIILTISILREHTFLVNEVLISNDNINIFSVNKVPFIFYTIYFCVYFGLSYVVLYLNSRRKTGKERAQVMSLFYAAVTSSFFALISNLILPLFGINDFIWLGPIFTLSYIVIVSLSVIRHQLFDIRATIAIILGYVGSFSSILAIYIATIYILSGTNLVGANLTTTQRIAFASIAVISGFLFSPFKKFFDRATNRFFYQDAYESQELIDDLNNALVATSDIDTILNKSSEIIKKNLKVESVVFFIRETSYYPNRIIGDEFTRQKINADDYDVLLSLAPKIGRKIYLSDSTHDDETEAAINEILNRNSLKVLGRLVSTLEFQVKGIGMFLLGPKISGSNYTKKDIKVLDIIANELVIAVENVLRYEEIEQFNVTLQKKIDAATKELKDSNQKLLALDGAKDEFVTMASHQLRTPLTTIKGYISMVLEGDAGDLSMTQKEMLGQAFLSSQRMVYLIADLLNVSRLKAGTFNIDKSKVNLSKLVEDEVSQLQVGANAKNITIVLNVPKKVPELMLDDMKTRQVIMNLTDNAIQYTPVGGSIKLQVKNKDKSIEFTVSDTGIGVPKEQHHKLFTKFFRADNARKVRPDGTGIGLFMAKKVIISQGGSLLFKSKEGKGSTFGFSFPKNNIDINKQ